MFKLNIFYFKIKIKFFRFKSIQLDFLVVDSIGDFEVVVAFVVVVVVFFLRLLASTPVPFFKLII